MKIYSLIILFFLMIASGCGNSVKSGGDDTVQNKPTQGELKKIKMASWSKPIAEQSNLYLAEKKGWFKKAGLDFQYIPGAGGGDAVKNIIAGNADIAFANLEAVLLAAEKGADLKIIYNIYPENVFNLVSLKGERINNVSDLKGKNVGVYSLDSGTYHNLKVLLYSAGMTEKDVNVIETGVLNFAPLMNKQVSAIAATDTGLFDAKQKGLGETNVINARDVLNTPSDVFVVTEETYREKKGMLKNFLQVYKNSVNYTIKNPENAASVAVNKAIDGQDKARNLEIIKIRNQTSVSPETEEKGLGYLNTSVLKEVEQRYLDIGLLKEKVGIESIVTNEIVEDLK